MRSCFRVGATCYEEKGAEEEEDKEEEKRIEDKEGMHEPCVHCCNI